MRSLGGQVADWIEDNLCHGPGDMVGEPIGLDVSQLRFLRDAYALDENGRRPMRTSVFSRPKASGKSSFAAMIALAEAFGPVRFERWSEEGEPIGRSVRSPTIALVATEEQQAGTTLFSACETMARLSEPPDRYDMDVGKTRILLPEGGIIRAISSAAASKDGGRETFIAADETALWASPELRELYAVLRRNAAKRRDAEPWVLQVSTAFAPGENNVMETTLRAAEDDSSILVDRVQGPDPGSFDWTDDAALRAAIAAAYGDVDRMDEERLLAEARDPSVDRSEFTRYFLNREDVVGSAWVSAAEWDRLPEGEIPAGDPVALALTGSVWSDTTCLVIVSLGEEPIVQLLEAWEGSEEAGVDAGEVDVAVRAACEAWKVVRAYIDSRSWSHEAAVWHDDLGAAFRRYSLSRRSQFGEALESLRAAIRAGDLRQSGDETLREHVLRARAVSSRGVTTIARPDRGHGHHRRRQRRRPRVSRADRRDLRRRASRPLAQIRRDLGSRRIRRV